MAEQAEGKPTTLSAPVVEVTLLEDRAHVVRRGVARVAGAGFVTYRIDDVSPVLSDKTLVAQVAAAAGATGARVVDARVRRRRVIRQRGPEPGTAGESSDKEGLEKARDELEADLDRRRSKYAVLERHAAGLEELAGQTYADLAADVSWGREIGGGWSGQLDELRERERGLRTRLVELGVEIAELELEMERLSLRIQVLDNPSEAMAAALEIDIAAEAEGEISLRVDYTVPGACWRPYHTARLVETTDAAQVAFSTDACAWQNTGEDWSDVELLFSTERPSLGTEPPELSNDILRWKKKSEEVVVETREQEVDTVGLGAAPAAVASELPGIDDGGESMSLRAAGRASIPSDGPRSRRMASRIGSLCLPSTAMPRSSSSPCRS